jgi:hypothetical protein
VWLSVQTGQIVPPPLRFILDRNVWHKVWPILLSITAPLPGWPRTFFVWNYSADWRYHGIKLGFFILVNAKCYTKLMNSVLAVCVLVYLLFCCDSSCRFVYFEWFAFLRPSKPNLCNSPTMSVSFFLLILSYFHSVHSLQRSSFKPCVIQKKLGSWAQKIRTLLSLSLKQRRLSELFWSLFDTCSNFHRGWMKISTVRHLS